ncbi:sugar transferase [Tuwongella immobilis]|nr:sugar transferase [Tuwongella immobilis]
MPALAPDRSGMLAPRCRVPADLPRICRQKSIFDRIVASCLLVVAVPVVAIACLLVRATSRGPAIYSQRRVGQYGKVFTIYKIRTMFHDCESFSGPRWSTPNDPRVTRLGKILRALHIDELPQLINVLKGEMSLIGPRPERPEIASKLRESIPGYDLRATIKPGVSGFAQIHLPPDTNLASVRKKLLLDLHYIENASLWFDVKIVLATALKVFGIHRPQGIAALPQAPNAEWIDG